MAKHIQKLRAQQNVDLKALKRYVKRARQRVAGVIAEHANKQGIATSDKKREELYAAIRDVYEELGQSLDRWGKEMAYKRALEWNDIANKDIGEQTGKREPVKFDRNTARKYWEIVHPDNAQHMAAVFTDKMQAQDIHNLRQAFIENFRQARLEGWTHSKQAKMLQTRWDYLAGNIAGDRFVDNAGRQWSNARYLQMLIRTTTARVARESYMDTLIQHGDDLMRITPSGDSCPVCQAWSGLIISISGLNKAYPSYQQALDAGMFHPNCDCFTVRVDELIDRKDIDTQADVKNVDWDDVEEVQKYHDKATQGEE